MATNPFAAARIRAVIEQMQVTTRQQVIETTLRRTAENQAAIRAVLGHTVPIERYVDGQLGKPVEQVHAGGFTLTRFDLFPSVIDEVLTMLTARSPYGDDEDGHYQDDHFVFVNDERREFTMEGRAGEIKPGDVVVIVNIRPYARRIENGLSTQAPDGVYELTARAMQRRFAAIARVRFAYRAVAGAPSTRPFPAIEITSRAG